MIPSPKMKIEPFHEDGRLGYIFSYEMPSDDEKIVEIDTLAHLEETDLEKAKKIRGIIDKKGYIWALPGRPDIGVENHDLERDIYRYFYENFEVLDQDNYSFQACWAIASGLCPEFVDFAPRNIFHGVTRSGKSHAMATLAKICYRGWNCISPTGSALYRTIEEYNTTTFIDEYQNISKERKPDVDDLILGGFDRTSTIPRTNKNGYIDQFRPFGFLALSTKQLPQEDRINRGIVTTMMEKTRGDLKRRIDEEQALELRTRVQAFRYRAMAGYIDIEHLKYDAIKKAEEPIEIDGDTVNLDSRSIDMASTLLVPALFFNVADEMLRIIARSLQVSNEGLRQTRAFDAFSALQALVFPNGRKKVEFDPSELTTRDVADQVNQDLITRGDEDTREGQNIDHNEPSQITRFQTSTR